MIITNELSQYQKAKQRGVKRKYEIIQTLGSCCSMCGYNKNISALEFHHTHPSTKSFQLDLRAFSSHSTKVLQKEIEKCVLLCANCHRELHNPSFSLNVVRNTVHDASIISFDKMHGDVCPVCGDRFPKSKGKLYCSKPCRMKDKNYPSIQELTDSYNKLGSWERVASKFGITRRVIQGIRKFKK